MLLRTRDAYSLPKNTGSTPSNESRVTSLVGLQTCLLTSDIQLVSFQRP